MKKFKSLLIVCALALGFAPLAINNIAKEEPNVVHATGGEPNPKATADQVHIVGVPDLNTVEGLTFDDGVLTIDSSFTNSIGGDFPSPAMIYVDTSVTADLTVVVNKHPFYATIANCNGNLTIDGIGLNLCEAYAGQNLTFKANIVSIFTHQYSYITLAGSPYQSKDSVVYAGEKISIEGSAFVTGSLSSASSIRSLLCAKSLEINTRGRVELSTYSIKGSDKQAPIVFHSCNSANDLAGKLVIRQGALRLGKHYDTEDPQYNDYFGLVGYTSNSNGNISNFDTDNKALADYEYAISDKTDDDLGITYKELVVKTRTVRFKENGGTGDKMDSLTYLPVGKEVTLPECTYTAPAGKQFAGWALGSADGTIKQPGETFVLEEGADPDDWATYDYYDLYAIWEDGAPTHYSITVNSGTASAASSVAGETITITANAPEEGYEFDRWTSDDVTFANANNTTTTFVMPAKNVTITATYKAVAIETTLSSITLSGNPKTIFEVGDTFSYEGLVVTAHYSDLTSAAVTGFTVSSPDMSTAGTKTITVSYTEGGVTKTATYQITVSEKELPPVDPETPKQPSKGLPAGAIAGIIIGSVLVVGIGGFALVWFVIKKKTWADFVALFKKK